MGRQWGPSLRVAEQAGCVVSASRAGQPDAGSWSCSGVILSRSPGLVLCHGGIFTPFLRTGSAALTQTGAAFLPGDSCSDDLRLHVQWGPTAASPAGRADQELPGLCTPQCASLGLEPGAPSRARARPLQPPRPAQLLLLLSCPAFRSHFARLFGAEAADQWHFVSSAPDDAVSEEEEEDQLRALGWFALLRVQRGAAAEERRGPAVTVAPLGAVAKGAPLLACGSPFGAFCPDIFLNTLSRGVLSNAAGPLLLTDARCLPGTEGGGVFAARPAGALVALVAAPLCWKAREWVGLTLLCAAAPLLQVARSALSRLHPDSTSLSALLPPEVGAPRGLSLRDLGSSWAAAAVLVECGAVWGSGVAVAPRLVVTCRHVAPRETARVLVHSATPRNVAIWGRVVFATQETSPYDIAVVSLEEELNGVPVPVPAEHFHEGIVASNTRDNNTGATYPHLNFSIPITVLQPALKQYSQTGDLCGLRELDHTTEPVRVVWRLQRPLPEAPRSKL
ncbi:trypsin domain containing 1 (predicted), isoform CRA_b [Rattus norvegicus]|uniref:Peroxisomal leader peptide-processing protease n=1 Tax=Rattus norvegicus TaxID=10116 RepID=A6K416_RAT|nr:peroxisomal leader peptide-processing protease isoform X1 [Rattus norvegicus]EDL93007.1 trypsin domain containing 1 (predicted), isoform CRA_b [Rattus norvegicus]